MLPVVESFLSFQGEGASVGRLAYFIRVAGCTLNCTWCDSKYASQVTAPATSVKDLVLELTKQPGQPIVVVTGGEPMLYQDGIINLRNLIPLHLMEIETNGTIEPSGKLWGAIPQFNVSPKLPSSGNLAENAIKIGVLSVYAHECNSIFKFVIKDKGDWAAMKWILRDVEIPNYRVWVMPEGRTPGEIRKRTLALIPLIKQSGYNLSPRFHVMIWGKKRGV